MNLLLPTVVSDVTGVTGMKILKAMLAGEHNPPVLAQFRDHRWAQSEQTSAKSLQGNYRQEHLVALQQAVELYETYPAKVAAGDRMIEQHLASLEDRLGDPARPSAGNRPDLHPPLYRLTGVDLSRGVDVHTAFKVVAETGTDRSPWPTQIHFTSWLGLAPGNTTSGGKRLSGKTRRTWEPPKRSPPPPVNLPA
jgi:transposase